MIFIMNGNGKKYKHIHIPKYTQKIKKMKKKKKNRMLTYLITLSHIFPQRRDVHSTHDKHNHNQSTKSKCKQSAGRAGQNIPARDAPLQKTRIGIRIRIRRDR